MTPTKKEFYDLAELLNQILAEDVYYDVADFKMPKEHFTKTATELQVAFEMGWYERDDEDGSLYYSGMTEDFGGLYEAEYEKHMTPEQREYFGLYVEEAEQGTQLQLHF